MTEPSTPAEPESQAPAPARADAARRTRAGAAWVATAVALVLLVLLIIFILQNQDPVQVNWLGFEGSVALGLALFIAAVGGGVLVAVAGVARIAQLRLTARRARRR